MEKTLQFEDVFQLFPTPGLLLLPNSPIFTIVAANNAYLDAVNFTESDLIGKGVFEAFPENPEDKISNGIENLKTSLELVIAKKDSHKMPLQKYDIPICGTSKFIARHFKIQNIPIKDNNNTILYILNSVEDVTDKENLEIAFQFERQRFKDLYLLAPSCMGVLKGPNHVYEIANPAYLQLLGKEDIIGKSVKEIRPEAVEQGTIEILDRVYKTGVAFSKNEKLMILDKEGNGKITELYQDILYQPHKDPNGKIDGISFFFIDVTEKVESRKKIEESEKKYRQIVETAQEGIWLVDKDNRTTFVNTKLCEILGYTPAEMIGQEIFNLMDAKGRNIVEKLLLSKEDIHTRQRRFKFFSNSGKEIWTRISANALFDEAGIFEGSLAMVTDITESKKAEEKVVQLNKELIDYKYALDESSIVAITDQKGIIKHVNHNFCKISKYSPEELIGQDHRIVSSGHHSKEYIKNLWKTISKGKVWKGELRNKAKDGSIYWVDTIITPFLDEKGKPYQYVATRFDVTEIKKAEENLEKQNIELVFQYEERKIRAAELIIANKELDFQNGEKEDRAAELFIANKELDFQNGEKENRAAELIIANKELAFQNGEKEKRAAELFIANKELAFQNQEKEKRANELILANHELVFQNADKENRAAELSISNKELIKTNTELDRFVYSVSHDLRSPLTSILGLISFIEEDSREPDTLEQVKMIRASINRLDGFIKNILSYSQNNRTELEMVKIPIKKTIHEIVDSVRNIQEARGITFQVDIDEQQPFYSDWHRFNTILENLISNAIKYHTKEDSGRYLKVTGTSNNNELKLKISDNGIGIDPEFHEKIFDMFYRLSGKSAGSGFGLYIVKETVEKLHGSIEIQSEKGVGTTFLITLKNLKE